MYLLGLLCLLKESQNMQVREFAAIMLRQTLLVNSTSPVWKLSSVDVHKQVQVGLLELFIREPNASLRRKITDAVAATATRISGKVGFSLATNDKGVVPTS